MIPDCQWMMWNVSIIYPHKAKFPLSPIIDYIPTHHDTPYHSRMPISTSRMHASSTCLAYIICSVKTSLRLKNSSLVLERNLDASSTRGGLKDGHLWTIGAQSWSWMKSSVQVLPPRITVMFRMESIFEWQPA